MLVLQRNVGQKIFLDLPSGEVVSIVAAKIDGPGVTIGIDAPLSVRIRRDDIKKLHPRGSR